MEQSEKIEITVDRCMFLLAKLLKNIDFYKRDDIAIKFIITGELNVPIRTWLEFQGITWAGPEVEEEE